MIDKVCEECGKGFKVYPYRKDTAKFCSLVCQNLWQKGKNHHPETNFKKGQKAHNYKGLRLSTSGRMINTFKGKVQYNYRRLIEQFIGRKLTKLEVAHHKDANKTNDRLDNFLILTNGDHKKMHHKAYDYLVATGQIEQYLIWLKENYSEMEWKTIDELLKEGT
jgi:hypothetical protein